MRIIEISKGNGKFRKIYVPNSEEKEKFRGLLPELMRYERTAAMTTGIGNVTHGFVARRSPVTMAAAHIGLRMTMSFDLADWFDSVTQQQISCGILLGGCESAYKAQQTSASVCVDGAPRQGLPTSPTAANLAAVDFDLYINDRLRSEFGMYSSRYTRYADDICISFYSSSEVVVARTESIVHDAAKLMNWYINEDKTKLQLSSRGRRIICGISVGDTDIRAPKRMRKKLRAARHQHKWKQAGGLAEWCKMRAPSLVKLPRGLRSMLEKMKRFQEGPVNTDELRKYLKDVEELLDTLPVEERVNLRRNIRGI